MYQPTEQELIIMRQAYDVLGRILGSVLDSGLPASAPVPVQKVNQRAEKRKERVKACLQNIEKHLGSGFTRFVNLNQI